MSLVPLVHLPLVPAVCNLQLFDELTVLGVVGSTLLVVESVVVIQHLQLARRAAPVLLPLGAIRLAQVVMLGATGGAWVLTILLATERIWYTGSSLRLCGLVMRPQYTSPSEPFVAPQTLAFGLVTGVFALLAAGTAITLLLVRQQASGDVPRNRDQPSSE